MKPSSRLPTILGLFLLIIGVTAGLFLLQKGVPFSLRAGTQNLPQQVKITNLTENSFTVSWVTDSSVQGSLRYGPAAQNLSLTANENSAQALHSLTLDHLSPQTSYSFRIANDTQTYQTTTAPAITTPNPANNLAYGLVRKTDGQPANNVLVYLTYPGLTPQSALTTASGNWVIPLHLARSEDLQSWFNDSPTTGELFIQAGPLGTASAKITTQNDTPVPVVTLGQRDDLNQAALLPTPSPEKATSPERFSLETSTIIINNPQADEKITTTRPEFWGTAPANTQLTLEINSLTTLTQQLTTSSTGSWSWTPSNDLPAGEHTVAISLPNGLKVARTFTVLAAGITDLPAFTASPSGQTTTSSPTPTLPPRTSKPATTAGTPSAGNLTPTFIISMLGMGLIISGLFIYGRFQSSFTNR